MRAGTGRQIAPDRLDDVDVEHSVPIIVRAIEQNASQTCTAGSRLRVQKNIYESLVAKVAQAFSKVPAGTPELEVDCGPLMNPEQLKRMNRYLNLA